MPDTLTTEEREQTCPGCKKVIRVKWNNHLAMCACGHRFTYLATLLSTWKWVHARQEHAA